MAVGVVGHITNAIPETGAPGELAELSPQLSQTDNNLRRRRTFVLSEFNSIQSLGPVLAPILTKTEATELDSIVK